METGIDNLLHKVRLIAGTPKGELLRQLVDLIYDRLEEDYDTEPLSEEDLEAISRAKEDIKHGRVISWDNFKRKHGL
jgi:hypothetical protein